MKPGTSAAFAAVFLAGIALGYFAGRRTGDSQEHATFDGRNPSPQGVENGLSAKQDDKPTTEETLPPDPSREATRRQDRIGRIGSVLTETSEDQRRAGWLVAMQNLQPEDAIEVRMLFRAMDRQGRTFPFEWEAFWKRWGTIDGPAALAYLLKEDGKKSWVTDCVGKALFGWGGRNPESALAWLAKNQDSPIFEAGFSGYISGLALTDVKRGTRAAVELIPPESPLVSFVMGVLAEGSVQQGGVPGLLTWFDALPEDPESAGYRSAAVGHVASRLRQAGPEPAMAWLAAKADTPWRSDDKIGEIADWVATTDPAGALRWLSGLPPSPKDARYPGITRVVSKWAAQDAFAFENWLNQPKPQPLQDQALAAYAKYLAPSSPDAAAARQQQVKDPRWLPRATSSTQR